MNYYLNINGEIKGPYPLDKLLEEGVNRNTMLCEEDKEEWQRAEKFSEVNKLWDNPIIKNEDKPAKTEKNNKREALPVTEILLEEGNQKEVENTSNSKPKRLSKNGIRIMIAGWVLILIILFSINIYSSDDEDSNDDTGNSNTVVPSVQTRRHQVLLDELVMKGDAAQGDTTLAKKYFREAFDLSSKIDGLNTKKMDSLAALYERRANDDCPAFKKTKSLYIIERDYLYASLLKGTQQKHCK